MAALSQADLRYIRNSVTRSNLQSPQKRLTDMALLKTTNRKRIRIAEGITFVRG